MVNSTRSEQRAILTMALSFVALVIGASYYALGPLGDDFPKSSAQASEHATSAPALESHGTPVQAAETASVQPETQSQAVRTQAWADVTVEQPTATLDALTQAAPSIYQQHCIVCHGAEGKGDGPASAVLTTRPRNFTAGMFKFKTSSSSDEMPYDDDIYRTITSGVPAAGMPAFKDLSVFERWALVNQVKNLAVRQIRNKPFKFFEKRKPTEKLKIPALPEKSQIDLAHGRQLFQEQLKCVACHGEKGLGDGASAVGMKDALDFPIKPADLTRGEVTFKTGSRPEDIYRVLMIGMAGTPMPSFASATTEKDRWDLAYYVQSLFRPIAPGERVFLKVGCASCHTTGRGKLIGPDLAGVTQRRDHEWLRKWIKDPPSMLATDETARGLLTEYLTPMPNYGLTDSEIEAVLQYLKTVPPPSETKPAISAK